MIPWRLISIGAAAVVVGLVLWRVGAWREGFLERDKAVADLAAYGAAVEAREKQADEERAADEARRAALSLKLETVTAELEALRANPIISVQWRTKEGEPCPRASISAEWFRVRREAYGIASGAVSGSD